MQFCADSLSNVNSFDFEKRHFRKEIAILMNFFLKLDEKLSNLVPNKAGYTATEVAFGWAGAVFEVTRPFGQKQ